MPSETGKMLPVQLERLFQKLDFEPDEKHGEQQMLSSLSMHTRQYLDKLAASQTANPDIRDHKTQIGEEETDTLKAYLCWCLKHKLFQKAVAAVVLLENTRDDVLGVSVFDDVMRYVTQEGPSDVIPPTLLVQWARILQVRGDLHEAIRQLNAAKKTISDNKSSALLDEEEVMILGECTQMAGLTLNKMCCWKSAVEPLMESVGLFRRCRTTAAKDGDAKNGLTIVNGDKAVAAAVVSMEMVAKCLCSITEGDFNDLKEQLGFPHQDRFYQAFSMCVEAAALATSSSELLFIRAQNQAAEALLKYAAHSHQLDPQQDSAEGYPETPLHFDKLEQVISEAVKSLKAHSGLQALQHREQFFEFVRSIFLISQALSFSHDSTQDRRFAKVLGERARVFYGEYCGQLSEKDFNQSTKIDIKEAVPEVLEMLIETLKEFELQALSDALKSDAGMKIGPATTGLSQTSSSEDRPTPAVFPATIDETPRTSASEDEGFMSSTRSLESGSSSSQGSSNVQGGSSNNKRRDMSPSRPTSSKKYHGQVEVGLPVEPEANAIPVYDVPLSIFQALCGCKVNPNNDFTSPSSNPTADEANAEYAEDDDGISRSLVDGFEQKVSLSDGSNENQQPCDQAQAADVDKASHAKSDSSSHDSGVSNDSYANGVSNDSYANGVSNENYPNGVNINRAEPTSQRLWDSQNGLSSPFCHADHDDQLKPLPLGNGTQDSGYASVPLVDTFLTTRLPYDSQATASSGFGSFSGSSDYSEESGRFPGKSELSMDKADDGSLEDQSSETPLFGDTVKRARLLKFNPVTGLWTSQTTLVYVGRPLDLDEKVKGNCRDAFNVQFLHQDEVLGRYVGKRYKRQRPPSQYLQDVTCQKTARFLVTLFNYALQDLRYDIQIVYVPVAHVQLLSRDGSQVVDWLNVEPYLEGDFIKLTNNLKFCNSQGRTLATALTHFTHFVSEGKLMLVDLQGWLPREGRGVVYLTDPQFHTLSSTTSLSSCDMGSYGMRAFWESVHPQCNAICQALGLKRPVEESD